MKHGAKIHVCSIDAENNELNNEEENTETNVSLIGIVRVSIVSIAAILVGCLNLVDAGPY